MSDMSESVETGSRIVAGRFELLRRIGAGAAGAVFAARDRVHGGTIALKRLRDADPRAVYQFKREFRSLADISHPNLVTFHGLFVDAGDFFLSMELIDGRPLSDFLRPGVAKDVPPILSSWQELRGPLTKQRQSVGMQLAGREGLRRFASPPSTGEFLARPVELGWDAIRDTFAQLAEAVLTLHSAGILHRDLKPSNVLVMESGRVVVLDFGLATAIEPAGPEAGGHSFAGTPAYMAPEQCLGKRHRESSDWYAVGVMLFEVLAGMLPHRADNLADLIWAKVEGALPPVTALNPAVPPDLAAICNDLLSADPDARPDGPLLLRRLGRTHSSFEAGAAPRRMNDVPLIGRDAELEILRRGFEGLDAGAPVVVRVDGISGVGKSALLDDFLERVVKDRGALVLRGRCYQQESLPFKTIDGVIDALARQLARLEIPKLEALLPQNVRELARIFPVLETVCGGRGDASAVLVEDPLAAKRTAFSALRELLVGVARERPLVIFVDDVHWGDLDSIDVIADLLRPPEAPPLLLVLAFRSEEGATSPFLRTLKARLANPSFALDIRDLPVGPLSPAASEILSGGRGAPSPHRGIGP
jgi:eukaryotic-like serine/threonine-protein kinase